MSILQGKEYRKKRGGQSIGVGGEKVTLIKGRKARGKPRGRAPKEREKTPTKGEPEKEKQGTLSVGIN